MYSFERFDEATDFGDTFVHIFSKNCSWVLSLLNAEDKSLAFFFKLMSAESSLSFLIRSHFNILQYAIFEASLNFLHKLSSIFITNKWSIIPLFRKSRWTLLISKIQAFDMAIEMRHDLNFFDFAWKCMMIPLIALSTAFPFLYYSGVFPIFMHIISLYFHFWNLFTYWRTFFLLNTLFFFLLWLILGFFQLCLFFILLFLLFSLFFFILLFQIIFLFFSLYFLWWKFLIDYVLLPVLYKLLFFLFLFFHLIFFQLFLLLTLQFIYFFLFLLLQQFLCFLIPHCKFSPFILLYALFLIACYFLLLLFLICHYFHLFFSPLLLISRSNIL